MNIIRKKFLVITLAVFVPIMVFVVFFASSAMEKIIEVAGTRAVGAEVNLGGADLALTLTSANLTNLQVTDPDEPMKNAFVADSLKFSLDGGNLLRRKVIINELSANGIKLGTPRARSGAIGKKKPAKKTKAASVPKEAKSPNVDSILEKEKSAIEKSMERVSRDIEADKNRLEEKTKSLVGDKEFALYKKRANKIKNTKRDPLKMLSAAKDLRKLNKDIKKDIKEIKNLSREVKAAAEKHNGAIKDLKEKELKRLMAKYSPTGLLSNITRSMFSPSVSKYVDKALMWSSKVKTGSSGGGKTSKPIRAKGRDVRFKEKNPLPNFLIKNAGLSVSIPQGVVIGSVIDITTDQATYGKPIKFEFSGTSLKGVDSISIKGFVDRTNIGKPKDSLEFSMRGYEFKKLPLGGFLLSGSADITSSTVVRGVEVASNVEMTFNKTNFELPLGVNSSKTNKLLFEALQGVHRFKVKGSISGVIDEYDIYIHSDLDNIVKKVLEGVKLENKKKLESKLSDRFENKMATELGALEKEVGGISNFGSTLEKKLNVISNFLK